MSNNKHLKNMNFKKVKLSSKIFASFFALFIITSSGAMTSCGSGEAEAEGNGFTDEELELFVEAVQQIMPLDQISRMQMMGELEDQDISVEKFNEINQAIQTGVEPDATQDEMDAFNIAMDNIEEIQVEFEEILKETIEETGLSFERYEEIIMAYEEDPELQERIHQLLEQQQPQQPEQPQQPPLE